MRTSERLAQKKIFFLNSHEKLVFETAAEYVISKFQSQFLRTKNDTEAFQEKFPHAAFFNYENFYKH